MGVTHLRNYDNKELAFELHFTPYINIYQTDSMRQNTDNSSGVKNSREVELQLGAQILFYPSSVISHRHLLFYDTNLLIIRPTNLLLQS
jgi:hypothetical protein